MINEATIQAQFKQATVKGSVATLQFEILTDNADAFRTILPNCAKMPGFCSLQQRKRLLWLHQLLFCPLPHSIIALLFRLE